jgi:DNA-binding LytR/AlgR family response regulator
MIIVTMEEQLAQNEIEVLIKYPKLNHAVNRIISLIKSVDTTIQCTLNTEKILINASAIAYIESVDKRTYVHVDKNIYDTEFRLYQLLEILKSSGFVQISKYCILNIEFLNSIKTLFNSRMDAILTNDEHLTVTRKFIPDIKAKLLER